MSDLVDIAIPVDAQVVAESLGLRVHRSITTGATIRGVPRDDAAIAVEYLREAGFTARIVERGGPPPVTVFRRTG